jgi:hypothetical protein
MGDPEWVFAVRPEWFIATSSVTGLAIRKESGAAA